MNGNATERKIVFRFDVDSITDGGPGLRSLAEIASKYPGFTATVFINAGRAIHRRTVLLGLKKTSERVFTAGRKISIRRKLGTANLIRTLVFNPMVASACSTEIRRAADNGFEIGLHGGRNHTLWQRFGLTFDERRVREEVSAGLNLLGLGSVRGFASPGYVVPPALPAVLKELGFAYQTNLADPESLSVITDGPLPDVPVNVVGPNTVPLMASLFAQEKSTDEIVELTLGRIKEVWDTEGQPVIYGHPSEECLIIRTAFELLVARLLDNGTRFIQMQELVRNA
jgi:hypothetical protein